MDERLLPTLSRLRGDEVLRVVGPDGKRTLLPVSTLLDLAERRFATRAGEDAAIAGLTATLTDLAARLTALEAVYDALPVVDTAPLEADCAMLRLRVNDLDARVALLEAATGTKPVKPPKDK